MVKQSNDTLIKIIAIVAIVGIAYFMFGTGTETRTQAPSTINWPGSTPAAVSQQAPASIVVQAQSAPDTDIHTGNLNLKFGSAIDNTGVTSNALLLDKSEARDENGERITVSGKPMNELQTRIRVMDTLNVLDKSGLKAYDGKSPVDVTPSSGTWTWSTTGRVGKEFLVFTYKDTSPAKAENISTAKLIKLNTWQKGDSTWAATIVGDTSDSASWNLYNYPYYDWMDSGNSPKRGIDYGNGGTAGTVQTIRFYGNASVQGEKLVDTALLINAPSNFTGKFSSLSVSDKSGHSIDFTKLKLASGVAGIDVTSGDVPSPTLNYNTYVFCTSDGVCSIPDNFDTQRTSNDRKELSFAMKTTTYSTQMNVTVYGLINSHAKSTTESFLFENPFEIGMSTGSTIAYW